MRRCEAQVSGKGVSAWISYGGVPLSELPRILSITTRFNTVTEACDNEKIHRYSHRMMNYNKFDKNKMTRLLLSYAKNAAKASDSAI